MGRPGGGFGFFRQGGGSNFCSRRGEGYRKIAIKNSKNRHFCKSNVFF